MPLYKVHYAWGGHPNSLERNKKTDIFVCFCWFFNDQLSEYSVRGTRQWTRCHELVWCKCTRVRKQQTSANPAWRLCRGSDSPFVWERNRDMSGLRLLQARGDKWMWSWESILNWCSLNNWIKKETCAGCVKLGHAVRKTLSFRYEMISLMI